MGYRVEYTDGKPLNDKPKPCAANQGTQITVENLFYNVPTRKRVLKSPAEEFSRISEVVSRYAIHNSGKAGFTLKKKGESGNEVNTRAKNSTVENIADIYGSAIARELIPIEKEDKALKFNLKGYVTKPNYNVKKFTFLLFINHRLVESSALKRSIESVYGQYLPKGTHPFAYLSLEIAPENIDVNVHPTKHEVHFLHQDEIIDRIQTALQTLLQEHGESRQMYTQPVLPGASVPLVFEEVKSSSSRQQPAPSEKVRTDPKMQKIDTFLVKPISASGAGPSAENKTEEMETDNEPSTSKKTVESKQKEKQIPMDTSDAPEIISQYDKTQDPEAEDGEKTQLGLQSIHNLQEAIDKRCHKGLRDLISNHTYVGCADREFALIQHNTKLYVVNLPSLSKHFFYQIILRKFGHLPALKLNPPVNIKEMVLLALDQPECGWIEADGEKEDLADKAVEVLVEKAEMLDDYFSMEIDQDANLISLPLLLDGYVPCFSGIPMLLLRLTTDVEWEKEEVCFDMFSREMARFYAVDEESDSAYDVNQHCDEENVEERWKSVMEHVLFPAMKKWFKPPNQISDDRSFNLVADLPELYKVFERC